jgi:hypothetical protein
MAYIGREPSVVTPQSPFVEVFNGTGVQTDFVLTKTIPTIYSVIVFISGAYQRYGTDYVISGQSLNFLAPPATGTGNVVVHYIITMSSTMVPVDASVTAAKIAPNTITNNKLARNANTGWVMTSGGAGADVTFTNPFLVTGGRGSIGGTNITLVSELLTNSSYAWSMTANSTLTAPLVANVPASGSWYIDITVDAVGGYTLSFSDSVSVQWNKVYGYSFDCVPNGIYRLWIVSRNSAFLDVNAERIK